MSLCLMHYIYISYILLTHVIEATNAQAAYQEYRTLLGTHSDQKSIQSLDRYISQISNLSNVARIDTYEKSYWFHGLFGTNFFGQWKVLYEELLADQAKYGRFLRGDVSYLDLAFVRIYTYHPDFSHNEYWRGINEELRMQIGTIGTYITWDTVLATFSLYHFLQSSPRYHGVVYRALCMQYKSYAQSYIDKMRNLQRERSTDTLNGFISTTVSTEFAKSYIVGLKCPFPIIMTFRIRNTADILATSISDLSYNPSEEEVLIMAGYQMRVVQQTQCQEWGGSLKNDATTGARIVVGGVGNELITLCWQATLEGNPSAKSEVEKVHPSNRKLLSH